MKAVALLLLLGVAGATAQIVSSKPLLTAIADNADLSNLLAAVKAYAPDLVQALPSFNGTLFAPSNSAFKAVADSGVQLTPAQYKEILEYHVVPSEAVFKSDLTDGQKLPTAQGEDLTVSYVDGNLTIVGVGSSAGVTRDLKISKAAVYIIDNVLLPFELPAPGPSAPPPADNTTEYDTIIDALKGEGLTTLLAAVQIAGVEDLIADFNGTVFAPSNEAFAAYIKDNNLDIATVPASTVQALLTYHVAAAKILSSDIEDGQVIDTLLPGETLTVVIEGSDVYLETTSGQKVAVTKTDIMGGDAVIHIVDEVLIPASLLPPAPTGAPPAVPTPPSGATSTVAGFAALAGSLLAAVLAL